MPVEVLMPMLGMAQETGKLVRWLKAEGDSVAKAEPLMEVETDKVTVEIEAPAGGTLAGVTAAEGDEVAVGTVIAYVLAAGEEVPAPVPREAAEAGGAESNGDRAEEAASPRALASPKARRLAAKRGVPIEEIAGSGPHGAVLAADVEGAPAALAPDAGVVLREQWHVTERKPLEASGQVEVSSAWRTMAKRLAASWPEVPHFYLSREVDASRLNAWREAARKRPGYDRLTHTDLFLKIAAAALAEHPRVNVSWQDGALRQGNGVNIGVAVATDDSLVVPVIHDADRLELGEIVERRADLVSRAHEHTLHPADVEGGTFTISNLGMFGVDAFGAIVNAPQVAILAIGRIAERVVAVDGAPAVRPTVVLTLSLDHCALDGAIGARFLDTVVSLVEEPAGLVS